MLNRCAFPLVAVNLAKFIEFVAEKREFLIIDVFVSDYCLRAQL